MKDRLIEVYNELKYKKVVKNQTDFGSKLGYGKAYFSQLMNGREQINKTVAAKIETLFEVNAIWLLTGKGVMFLNRPSHTEAPNWAISTDINNKELLRENKSLKQTINSMRIIIDTLTQAMNQQLDYIELLKSSNTKK